MLSRCTIQCVYIWNERFVFMALNSWWMDLGNCGFSCVRSNVEVLVTHHCEWLCFWWNESWMSLIYEYVWVLWWERVPSSASYRIDRGYQISINLVDVWALFTNFMLHLNEEGEMNLRRRRKERSEKGFQILSNKLFHRETDHQTKNSLLLRNLIFRSPLT